MSLDLFGANPHSMEPGFRLIGAVVLVVAPFLLVLLVFCSGFCLISNDERP